jgi:hypothetical protein
MGFRAIDKLRIIGIATVIVSLAILAYLLLSI